MVGRIEIMFGKTLTNAFVMLKTVFNKHWLIKISMKCVYTKLEVKKKDTKAMTTATSEACIVWLDEKYYFMGNEWHFW